MKKENKQCQEDDLRPEYDLKSLLKSGIRGKYAHRFQEGTNIVILDPDVASVFPNGKAVNEALRLVIQLRRYQDQAARYVEPYEPNKLLKPQVDVGCV